VFRQKNARRIRNWRNWGDPSFPLFASICFVWMAMSTRQAPEFIEPLAVERAASPNSWLGQQFSESGLDHGTTPSTVMMSIVSPILLDRPPPQHWFENTGMSSHPPAAPLEACLKLSMPESRAMSDPGTSCWRSELPSGSKRISFVRERPRSLTLATLGFRDDIVGKTCHPDERSEEGPRPRTHE